jgi:hypothetical protein
MEGKTWLTTLQSISNILISMELIIKVSSISQPSLTPKECAYLLEIVWTLQLTQMSLLDVENTE